MNGHALWRVFSRQRKKQRIGLTYKVAGVFVLFAALLLALVGSLAYYSGHDALQEATITDLHSAATEKSEALDRWMEEQKADIVSLAAMPGVVDDLAILADAREGSAASRKAHDRLVKGLTLFTGHELLGLFVMAPADGRIIVSTDPRQEGRFKEDRPYYLNGKDGPTVHGPYNSLDLGGPAITVAAPVTSPQGRLVGVLAGQLNLDDMGTEINPKSSSHKTDDAYLVNRSRLFVTQPRFISDPVVLRRGIHTEAVKRGLQGESGHLLTSDYRGVPTIAVYRWLPAHQLCLVVERDQREAFAPSQAFGKVIMLIAFLALVVASAVAVGLARTITRPILALQAGAARLGRGEGDVHFSETAQDELGDLAREFNRMAAAISEREAALLRWAHIFQRAEWGIAISGSDRGNLDLMNPAFARMYGYTEEELSGRPVLEMCIPEWQAETQAHLRLAHNLGHHAFESLHVRKGGAAFPVLMDVTVVKDESGGVLYLAINVRDITERKRAEEALHESEERFRTIFEQAAVGVAQVESQTGRFVKINQKYCDIVGHSREEMLNRRFQDITHPEDLDANLNDMTRLMAKEVRAFSTEKRYLHKNGSVVWVNLHVSPMQVEGQQPFFHIAIVEDITEHKRAEKSLRQSEANARRLDQENAIMAEIGRIVSSTLNVDEVYEAFAVQVRKVLSFDRIVISIIQPDRNTVRNVYIAGEGILDRNIKDAYPLKGSGHAEMVRTKSTFLIQTDDFREYRDRFPGLWSTFQEGFRSMMNVPLFSKGELIGALLLRSRKLPAYSEGDVSLAERIGAQIAGAIANAQLFNDLRMTEKSLRESEEHLHRAEKMEALGQLAGGVAHDLNNVLGVSTIYSELLQEKIPEESPLRKYVDNILSSTQKGAAIIQDLLTLARRGVTASAVMNLNGIVSTFLKTPVFEKIEAYHPNVTFRAECQEELLNIKGSPLHLEKTLMNLVSNAAEAISGKGEVTIRTENRYIDRPIQGYDEIRGGDYAVLTISDTGTGILAENLGRIFEPFYTKKTMGRSGTGLGLAIVWGTVKDHNGYIDVQTEVGVGTAFTLYFPVTREELAVQPQKVPRDGYLGHGESVLVVDDVAEQRDIASSLLTRLGYAVHQVCSGEEAVEYLRENKADILVLDMIMPPGIDGLETYERVLKINPHQKAIIVSGFAETERVKKAQEMGAGPYVGKPYLMERIGVALRGELGRPGR